MLGGSSHECDVWLIKLVLVDHRFESPNFSICSQFGAKATELYQRPAGPLDLILVGSRSFPLKPIISTASGSSRLLI